MELHLLVLPAQFAVLCLPPADPIPAWANQGAFVSVTRTPTELSIVCPQANLPANFPAERGWRCLMVEGMLEFSLVGILAQLSGALAAAGISLFVVSTYHTDYLLVKESVLMQATVALRQAGCVVTLPQGSVINE